MIENRLTDAQQTKLQQQFSQLGAAVAVLSLLLVGIYIQKQEIQMTETPHVIEMDGIQSPNLFKHNHKKEEAAPYDTASYK